MNVRKLIKDSEINETNVQILFKQLIEDLSHKKCYQKITV